MQVTNGMDILSAYNLRYLPINHDFLTCPSFQDKNNNNNKIE